MVAKKLVKVKVTTELRRSEKAAKLPITMSPITASPIMTNFAPVSDQILLLIGKGLR